MNFLTLILFATIQQSVPSLVDEDVVACHKMHEHPQLKCRIVMVESKELITMEVVFLPKEGIIDVDEYGRSLVRKSIDRFVLKHWETPLNLQALTYTEGSNPRISTLHIAPLKDVLSERRIDRSGFMKVHDRIKPWAK